MKFLAKIFLILTFILTSCKNKEAIENDRTLESKTSITQSTEESKSADLYLKDFSYLFEYNEENSNQLIGIDIVDKKTIKFHLITETLPCDTEYWGIAENELYEGHGEIDEYLKEEKEFLIGIRLAENLSKVTVNYIQKDSLYTDCLPITQKIMKRIK